MEAESPLNVRAGIRSGALRGESARDGFHRLHSKPKPGHRLLDSAPAPRTGETDIQIRHSAERGTRHLRADIGLPRVRRDEEQTMCGALLTT